jgi:hypothetical protein
LTAGELTGGFMAFLHGELLAGTGPDHWPAG